MKLEDRLDWCLDQNKGIRLVNPSNNICREYLKKARGSLNIMNSAVEKKEIDWIATTAYYARYFALYTLLRKCGVKSEIHDCSISIFNYLFVQGKILENKWYRDIFFSKNMRIDFQYYIPKSIDKNKIDKNVKNARLFVLRMEKIIETINQKEIESLREKVKDLLEKTNDN